VFVLGDTLLDRNQIERRVHMVIQTDPQTTTLSTSPLQPSA